MTVLETFPWRRPDGRTVHTTAADLPQRGDGIWLYRPRGEGAAPVVVLLTAQPDGFIRIALADRAALPGLAGSRWRETAAALPALAVPGATPPRSVAEALVLAMAWADRREDRS